jgi:hypothetical protein
VVALTDDRPRVPLRPLQVAQLLDRGRLQITEAGRSPRIALVLPRAG